MNKTGLLIFASVILFASILLAFRSHHSQIFFSETAIDTTGPVFKAKDHKGKNVISANGVITLTSGLDNDYYHLDSIHKTTYLYIETKLSKFVNQNAKRVPLNISIVIDRSGSMQGVKMGYAKKAAKGIIDQLQPEDHVSIVMYDNMVDSVQVPVLATDKESIKNKINSISPRGGTNLWGGTELGYEYVQRNYKAGYINRVLLISDGLANVGLTDSNLIRLKVQKFKDDKGITLSTFGVGLDYNESLMTDMAETGAGNYYFIAAPEKLTTILSNELNGLLNVAAQNAELKIKLPQGASVKKGYPLKFEQNGDEITVKFRDLFSEEIKAIVFTISIADKINTILKFTSTLSYTDVTDGQQKWIKNENVLSPIKNVDAYLTHFNKKVIEQTILFTANENLERVMSLVDKGDMNGARKFLSENQNYLKANAAYTASFDDLRAMDSISNRYTVNFTNDLLVNADSVKKLQKETKNVNYKIRNKKQ